MRLRRTPQLNPALLFVAPALQVALILIFFLLMSSSFMLQPGIAVEVPKSPFLLKPQRNPVVVSVTSAPMPAIFFDNQEVDPGSLKRKLQAMKRDAQTIIVQADSRAPFEKIAKVMNIGLELGFPVVLATKDSEAAP